MITINEIKINSTEHSLGGRITRYGNDSIIFSVVGGRKGLYGDFENTFELAIIDRKTREFLTKSVLKVSEDICPWMSSEELIKISNDNESFFFFSK